MFWFHLEENWTLKDSIKMLQEGKKLLEQVQMDYFKFAFIDATIIFEEKFPPISTNGRLPTSNSLSSA